MRRGIKEGNSETVVFLNGAGVFEGHEGVRKLAAHLEYYMGSMTFEYTHAPICDDYAFLEWTASDGGMSVRDGADRLVIKDRRIIL